MTPGPLTCRRATIPGTSGKSRTCTAAPDSAQAGWSWNGTWKSGPSSSIDRLLDPPAPTSEAREILDGLRDSVSYASDARVERLKAYWLYRIVFGHDPLREKMTLFWHGHFATSNRKVQNLERMLAQNELFRRLALGDFRELATSNPLRPGDARLARRCGELEGEAQ